MKSGNVGPVSLHKILRGIMVVAFNVTVWPRESDYHDKEDRIF